jgi:hypothetical protein
MDYSATLVQAKEKTERTEIVVSPPDEHSKDRPDYECDSYVMQRDDVELMRAAYGGTKALRKAGKKYLPKHPMEEDPAYQARLGAAVAFNALAKTVSGLTGMIFRKDPTYEGVPPKIEADFENIDQRGQALAIFLRNVSEDALLDGHQWLHIDAPRVDPRVRTRADEQAAGVRPYWIAIKKSQAINWRYELRAGRPVLTLFAYRESVKRPVGDFGEESVPGVRVLREIVTAGVRTVQGEFWEYRESTNAQGQVTKKWVRTERYPVGVDEIPVVIVYAKRSGIYESEPPLRDLAYEQIEHYRVRSDRQKSMTFSSISVPWLFGTGVTDEEGSAKVAWGPDGMMLLNSPDATTGMLESQGHGLEATKEELQEIQARMASLGLQMLVRRTQVTATEKILDKTEADADLAAFAISVEDAVNRAIEIHGKYRRIEAVGTVALNRDFHAQLIDPTTLRVVSDMVSEDKLSWDTLMAMLIQGELLPPGFDLDVERRLIAAQSAADLERTQSMMFPEGGKEGEGADDDDDEPVAA